MQLSRTYIKKKYHLHVAVVGVDRLDIDPAVLKTNIISLCKSGVNDYHAFSCLLKYLQSPLFLSVLHSDPVLVTQVMLVTLHSIILGAYLLLLYLLVVVLCIYVCIYI